MTNATPGLVSVIPRSYNRADLIECAIKSVLGQTLGSRVRPWILEFKAMSTFHRRDPSLVLGSRGGRRFADVRGRWGWIARGAER